MVEHNQGKASSQYQNGSHHITLSLVQHPHIGYSKDNHHNCYARNPHVQIGMDCAYLPAQLLLYDLFICVEDILLVESWRVIIIEFAYSLEYLVVAFEQTQIKERWQWILFDLKIGLQIFDSNPAYIVLTLDELAHVYARILVAVLINFTEFGV